jgi:hypothetical protein
MKKLFYILIIHLVCQEGYSQVMVDTTKFYIKHLTDQMTDKQYFIASAGLLCTNDGDVGFLIRPTFELKKGRITYTGLSVKSSGIGNCVENSEINFLFEDGSKLMDRSWNDFNCKGNSYFDFKSVLLSKVNKPLKAVRFTNGREFKSFTYTLKPEETNYFIEVSNAVDQELVLNKGFIE